MARNYDSNIFGKNFEFELSPDVLAFEMSMDFSNQVLRRCDELDITMKALAEELGISISTLSEKLNGQNLTLKSMAALAIALGCDASAPSLLPTTEVSSALIHESLHVDAKTQHSVIWNPGDSLTSRTTLHINQQVSLSNTNSFADKKVA